MISSNKQIAKNTIFLYLRMILILGISLYTSRVVLRILGVIDYGVYNVVAGVVMLLGSLSGSLSGATSRFITHEIGKEALGNVKEIFRCCVTVHYILAVAVIIIAETIGLWFVMNKLVIPSDRMIAALGIYQCSIVAVAVKIVSTPYNAIIIAYERMGAFAYLSLLEVIMQLGLIFALGLFSSDRLIWYGVFLAGTQVMTRIAYNVYCRKHFNDISSKWLWRKNDSKEIIKFAGWSLAGCAAVVGYTQGINILLNLFFGPIANAARGFSNQIQAGVTQLSNNFQMALRPPIIKAYAQNEWNSMHTLMIAHAKYSFYLVLLMIVPIIISTPYILKLWLENVPEYTIGFVRLTLIGTLYCTLNGHAILAVHASGNMKKFQITEGTLLLITLPMAYILLKYFHLSAYGVIIVYLIIEFLTQFVRVWISYPLVNLQVSKYFKDIICPVILVLIPMVPYTLFSMDYFSAHSFGELVQSVFISVIVGICVIFFLGLSKKERSIIKSQTVKIFYKLRK